MLAKFKAAGLTDVRIQPLDLVPQWFPQSWEVTMTGGGKTHLAGVRAAGLRRRRHAARGDGSRGGLRGLGSEADFAGRDVKGKAVFVFTMLGAPERRRGAAGRRERRGSDLRGQHAARQRPVSGVPARHQRRRPSPSGTTTAMRRARSSRAMPAGQSRAREGEAERPARAEPQDRAHLGHAARRDRRDDLHHGAPRRLVRRVRRQRRRRGLDARPGRALRARFRRRSASGRWCSSRSTATTTRARGRRSATSGSSRTGRSSSPRPRWRSTSSIPRRSRRSRGRATTTPTRSCGAIPTCRSSGTPAVRRGPSSRRSPRRRSSSSARRWISIPNPTPPASDMSSFFRFLPGIDTGRIPPLLPHRPGNAADGAVDGSRSLGARVREDHRRGEQAPLSHVPAPGGADAANGRRVGSASSASTRRRRQTRAEYPDRRQTRSDTWTTADSITAREYHIGGVYQRRAERERCDGSAVPTVTHAPRV